MRLRAKNQRIDIPGEEAIRVLREIELVLISLHKIGSRPEDYFWRWVYVRDTKGCTWETYLDIPGQYAIDYIADGLGSRASTPVTIGAGAQNRIEPPAPPSPPPAQKAVQYMGCFKDSNNPFDLDGYLERSNQNSPQRCIQTCAAKGFAYAGVQYGQSCVCGNRYGTQGQSNSCNMACTGDSKTVCGGANANSVYSTGR